MRPITARQSDAVMAMLRAGKSIDEVASATGYTRSTVAHLRRTSLLPVINVRGVRENAA